MGCTTSAWAVVAASILVLTAARAQESPMPNEIANRLIEIGRNVDPPNTAALYAPLQEKEPYQGVRVERDVKYGPAERNLLDVFVPATSSSAARPVLIFAHGGAFIGGDKRTAPDSPFYDNIMLWAVQNGFIGVNMTYRLAPAAPWPAGAEDVASAAKWVADKIGDRGGDPARIYLMGHSAGAIHVATYVAHPEFQKLKGGGIAGAIMISGAYDLTTWPAGNGEIAYFGSDRSTYAERSSLKGLVATKTPLMVVSSELDPPGFVEQFNLLKEATCKTPNGCAHAVMLPQHSHMSQVYSINTADTRLTDEILDFVTTGK